MYTVCMALNDNSIAWAHCVAEVYTQHIYVIDHSLTKTEHVLANRVEVVSLSFVRGMEDDYSGPQDRQETTDLPVEIEFLLQ